MITKDNFKSSKGYQQVQDIVQSCASNIDDYQQLLSYLETGCDYFWAPASTKYHLSEPGGLCIHSLNVYNCLCELNDRNNLDISKESIMICGLFHDLGKVNFYVLDEDAPTSSQMDFLNSLYNSKEIQEFTEQGLSKAWASNLIDWAHKQHKQGDRPVKTTTYKIVDLLPLGHAARSLSILQDYLILDTPEKLAIRWHTGVYEQVIGEAKIAFEVARRKYPIVAALQSADYESAFIIEAF